MKSKDKVIEEFWRSHFLSFLEKEKVFRSQIFLFLEDVEVNTRIAVAICPLRESQPQEKLFPHKANRNIRILEHVLKCIFHLMWANQAYFLLSQFGLWFLLIKTHIRWLRQLTICLQRGRPGFDPWVRKIPWGRKWQPTPVFLPGEFHGQRSLAGYGPWGHKESDTTEWLTLSLFQWTLIDMSALLFFNLPIFSII